MKARNLLVVDGHNFLWRAYGVPFKFHSRKGTPLHVTTAFLSLLRRAVSSLDGRGGCAALAVVFDHNSQSSNHLLSPAYKANRREYSAEEESPFRHLPYIQKSLKHLRVKFYEKRGVEADDLIASIASRFLESHRRGRAFIASTDSDFHQLLSGRLTQLVLKAGGACEFLTPREFEARFGIRPNQYVFFKSLTGDKADNIAGIPKVGPVRAGRIVNGQDEFDLRPHAAMLELNQKLIRLDCSLSACRSWKPLLLHPRVLKSKNQEIFSRLGF